MLLYLYICKRMKSLNKKILISLAFMLTLVLPMAIGVAHAFHQHENNLCVAQDESHFHAEKTDCDQLHYFSQTLTGGEVSFIEIQSNEILVQNQFNSEFKLLHSFSKSEPTRGPPVINVF